VLQKCIGQGGMGRVYRAQHTMISRHFAVKVLFGTVATDEKARERFKQEAEAISRLDHPNLVSIADYGEWEGRPYLVMDYVEGINLAEIVQTQAPLPPERVVGLARQLAAGLQHAHERELIHRDFKPANIIVVREGPEERPRILDFGLAILADTDNQRLTTNGLVLGTPAFMSPEQACGEPIDHRSDLFALGLIMYEMLAGKHPFDGTGSAIARQNLAAPAPPFRKRAPAARVPPVLEAIVFRLLEKDPPHRFQSAAQLIAALDQLFMPPSVRAASQSLSLPQMRPRRRWPRSLAVVGAAVLAVALAAAGGLWRYRGTTQPDAAGQPASMATVAPTIIPAALPGEVPIAVPAVRSSAAAEPGPEAAQVKAAGEPERADAEAERAPDRAGKKPARSSRRLSSRRKSQRAQASRDASAVAAADVSLADFRDRYRAVGAQVDLLERKRGSSKARPLRERYLAIPYFDALRVDALRRDAYRKLGDIGHDVRRALDR
jgi:tRNA A-37 threonylcarbamoyl transferase component Bud32